jgi:hypothetical protein
MGGILGGLESFIRRGKVMWRSVGDTFFPGWQESAFLLLLGKKKSPNDILYYEIKKHYLKLFESCAKI